jgi:hypothetical protein
MNTNQKVIVACIFVISLAIVGCGAGQLFGPAQTPTPTIPPTPTLTLTPKPVTADDLSAAALKSTDLPAGFNPLSGNDLQGMQTLPSVVTTDFPNAKVAGFTAFGKKLDSGSYDAIVVSFYFYPLSTQDITVFDNPDLSLKTFSHGAQYTECLDCNSGKYIGDYSLNLSLGTSSFNIDEVVARRNTIGFAAMVLSSGNPNRLDLASAVAQVLNNNIQKILGK